MSDSLLERVGAGGGGGTTADVNVVSWGGALVSPAAAKADGGDTNLVVPEVGARSQLFNGASWDRARSGFVGPLTAPFTGIQTVIPLGVFNAVAPALADGQAVSLQFDAAGQLKTSGGGGGASIGLVGAAVPGSANYTGFIDAAGNLQGAHTYDTDTGGGVENTLGTNLRISSGGGSIEAKGQQLMALSIPVALASNQSAIPVTPANVGLTGAAVPTSAGYGGFIDAAGNLQGARTYDTDTGGGVENTLGVNLRFSAGGGSVEAGTLANPFVVLVANTLTVNADQGNSNNDATDGWSTRLTDGTSFYSASNPVPTVNSPNATSNNTASLVTNFGTDGSILVKGSPGNVFACSVSQDGTTKRYIQLFDKASAPVNTDVPLLVFVLPPASGSTDAEHVIGTDFFGTEGTHFAVGIAIGVSSTKNTFTEDGTSEKAIQVKFK